MQDKTLIHLREWLAQGDCARVAENCEKLAGAVSLREPFPKMEERVVLHGVSEDL